MANIKRTGFLVGFAIFVLSCSNVVNSEMPNNNKYKDTIESLNKQIIEYKKPEPQYVLGEVIVKLKEKKEPKVLFSQTYSTRKANNDNILSTLKTKYRLRDEKPVFKGLHEQLRVKNLTQNELDKENEIKSHNNQSRIPKPQKQTDLLPVYVLKTDEDVLAICKQLKQDSDVEYAQPNYIYHVQMVPNDPYYHSSGSWGQSYGDLWGIKKIQCENAWDISQGEGVIVAVIDSGVNYNHPDLWDNIWVNPAVISDINGDGKINLEDCDINGNKIIEADEIIDGMFGWDFANGDNDPLDGHGHGTHCSGTIAGVGNNEIGVIGIAPKAKIMAVKGLDDSGSGYTANLADGIRYAADNGAKVLSNSWGPANRNPSDATTESAVHYAYEERGCVVVFAAGNESDDVTFYSPANDPEVIAVAATTENDEIAYFSNWGGKIAVSAPGGGYENELGNGHDDIYNILSTISDSSGLAASRPYLKVADGYYRLAGTSMACPHVAGLAAVIRSMYPADSNDEIYSRIVLGADNIDSLNPGFEGLLGRGRVNVYKSLTIAERPFLKLMFTDYNDIEPGKTGSIIVHIKNLWQNITGTTATLSTDNQYVTIENGAGTIGDIATGETKSNSDSPFVLSIDENCPWGASIDFTFTVTDQGSYEETFNFVIKATYFRDVGRRTGLLISDLFPHVVGLEDYNDDDYPDAWCIGFGANGLYKNNGNGTFTNADSEAGVYGLNYAAWAVLLVDTDNDGDKDLFVGRRPQERNLLFLNNGNGTFTDISESSTISQNASNSAVAFDYDNNGLVDIYTGDLQRNNGDDTFTQLFGEETGLPSRLTEYPPVVFDYDNDGYQDIFFPHPGLHYVWFNPPGFIELYHNNADGTFTEVTQQTGLDALRVAAYGATVGDYNNDGHIDLLITGGDVDVPATTLYKNNGDGTFTDVTAEAGTPGEWQWGMQGTDFFDMDNDGYLDIVLTVGAASWIQSDTFYRNNGDGTFTDVTNLVLPDGVAPILASVGIGDYDNDGDLDVYAPGGNYYGGGGTFLENVIGSNNNWLKIKLEDLTANRLGYGARVYVKTGGRTQTREVHNGSVSTLPLHFGLSDATIVDEIEVHWPTTGYVQKLTNVGVNQTLTITQEAGSRSGLNFSSSIYTVDENLGVVTITVIRTGNTIGTSTVNYSTSNGSAIAGKDYIATSGILAFAIGETNKTFTIPIINDDTYGGNKTINLTLSNPSYNADLGNPSTAVLTIIDDDCAILQFASANYTVNENDGTATITINRTNIIDSEVSVDYSTSDGTAIAGTDYTTTSGTLTFYDGETEKTFTVPIIDDPIYEGNKTIELILSNPTGEAILGIPSTAILTVIDDEGGTLQFEYAGCYVGENTGSIEIKVIRSEKTSGTVTVDYATSDGTATADTDYTTTSGTFTFASGETEKTFTVPIIDDQVYEGDETINLALSNPTGGASLEFPFTITVVIIDDEGGKLQFSSSLYAVNENEGLATITVNRTEKTGGTVTVDYATSDGTAIAGEDYTQTLGTLTFYDGDTEKTFTVSITDDEIYEGDETITLTLSDPTGGAILGSPSTTVLTILDDECSVSFMLLFDVLEATRTVSVGVGRTGGTAGGVTVDYATTGGTATAGEDYTAVSETLTFASGETFKTFFVPINEDEVLEGDETIVLTLSNPTGGAVLGEPHEAVITIIDTTKEFKEVSAISETRSGYYNALGDYDNDGDLDLAVGGDSIRIYKNEDDIFNIAAELPEAYCDSTTWLDYDNDGDLDLAIGRDGGMARIYENGGNDTFSIAVELLVPGGLVDYTLVAGADYDNDGDLDLAVSGANRSGSITIIYKNNGGAFTDINAGLMGANTERPLAWGDYDNDGDLDLVVGADSAGTPTTIIYKNNGNDLFDVAAQFPGARYSSLAWGDYDNDGDLDLAVDGYFPGNDLLRIYRNEGNNIFNIAVELLGVRYSSLAWGDYDNDGWLDIALSGVGTSNNFVTKIYKNNNGNTFTEVTNTGLAPILGGILFGDYNNDGRLDIVLSGRDTNDFTNFTTKIYRSRTTIVPNTAPTAPTNLDYEEDAANDAILLKWDSGSDAETLVNGLYYNIRVGTSSSANDIVSGVYGSPLLGNYLRPKLSDEQLGIKLKELLSGTYYWSVQTIDTALKASDWSEEQTFTVINLPCAISGEVITLQNGTSRVIDVVLNLDGTMTATTNPDSNGIYNFTGLEKRGDYVITPTLEDYYFFPSFRVYPYLITDQTGQDFVGLYKDYDSDEDGLPDWWEWMHFEEDLGQGPDSDPDGDGWTNLEEYTENTDPNDPTSKPFISISGKVNLLGGNSNITDIILTLTGTSTKTTNPDTNNNYNFTELEKGSYIVTPSLADYYFFPSARSYPYLNSSQAGQDFTGLHKDYDSDEDGLPDWWEWTYFGEGNLDQGPNDDPDNDGWTNLEEYQNNTDPNDPASKPLLSISGKVTLLPTAGKKKPLTISGSTTDLTNYQVKVNVDYDLDMQADFGDLRFVDTNGNTLDYWLESYTDSTNAVVWVKVPSIPTSGTTIYMHYGDSEAESLSNGENTFIFFDDFTGADGTAPNPAKWTVGSSVAINNNKMRINAGLVNSLIAVPQPCVVEYDYMPVDDGAKFSDFSHYLLKFGANSVNIIFNHKHTSPAGHNKIRISDGVSDLITVDNPAITHGTNYRIKIIVDNIDKRIKIYVDDMEIANYDASSKTFDSRVINMNQYLGQDDVDNYRIRKYTSTEPSVTVGDEITVSEGSVEEVVLSLTGASTQTTNPGTNNSYSFTGLCKGTYTVTLSLADYHFFPSARSYPYLNSSQAGQDFTGLHKDYDSDEDGLPDWWEWTYFGEGNLDQGPNDDPDNDGWTNLEEYTENTDPNDPASKPLLSISGKVALLPTAGKKKPLTISGSTTDLTNYQVKVNVDYDLDMQADFADLRFFDSSLNPLDYWIESYTPSTEATVWVKVPSIPSSGITIYMHYGDPDAISLSNGENTFIFFDDFTGTNGSAPNPVKWSVPDSPVVINNNKLRIGASQNSGSINSLIAVPQPCAVEYDYMPVDDGAKFSDFSHYLLKFGANSVNIIFNHKHTSPAGHNKIRISDGLSDLLTVDNPAITHGTNYRIKIIVDNIDKRIKIYVDDMEIANYDASSKTFDSRVINMNQYLGQDDVDNYRIRQYASTEPTVTIEEVNVGGREEVALREVILTLTGASAGTTNPDTNDNYSFTGLEEGLYTVTPSLEDYYFFPSSRSYPYLTTHQLEQNFKGLHKDYDFDEDGLPDWWEWTYFGEDNLTYGADDDPDSDGYTNLKEYEYNTNPNDADSIPTCSISGQITLEGGGTIVEDVVVSLRGSLSENTCPDMNGDYTFTAPVAGIYTVTPTLADYHFFPVSRSYGYLENNYPNQDFTGLYETYDSDEDKLPDWWELDNFDNLEQSAGDDFDKDGYPNIYEYTHSTSPVDIYSIPISDIYVSTLGSDDTGDGSVDAPYLTIQKGIDSAGMYNIVEVTDGTYRGRANRNLSWDGEEKHIIIKSADGPAGCIIDCRNKGAGFYLDNTSQTNMDIIMGFTIKKAKDYRDSHRERSRRRKHRRRREEYPGSGIYCNNASPAIVNCIITDNKPKDSGGGIYCEDSSSVITNCRITGNDAEGYGGGIYSNNSAVTITNCTIADNRAKDNGGGIYCRDSFATVTNSILWDNDTNKHGHGHGGHGQHHRNGSQIALEDSLLTISYSNISGGEEEIDGEAFSWGAGNINEDPLFVNVFGSDYRLLPNSPCIDIADDGQAPVTDILGSGRVDIPDIGFAIADIGAYEYSYIWYVDDDIPISGNGRSWTTAFKYLQDALINPELVAGDEIWVTQGTYNPDQDKTNPDGTGNRTATFQLINGVAIKGGYAGIGADDPKERDIANYQTVLSGDLLGKDGPDFSNYGDNSYHVVTASGTDETAILDGFIIRGGCANGSYSDVLGAGLFCGRWSIPSSATIRNCVFSYNWADGGGAVYLGMPNGMMTTFTNCIFDNNTVGINNCGPSFKATNCVFTNNIVGINDTGSGEITNCTLYGNTGYAISSKNSIITNCILWNNGDNIWVYPEYWFSPSNVVVSYCDIQGGYTGEGNIDADPLFVNANNSAGTDVKFFTLDDGLQLYEGSPCIDVANDSEASSTDILGQERIGIADIGAYEFTAEQR